MAIVAYEIKQKKGRSAFIMVEIDDDQGGLPRRAAASVVEQSAQEFGKVLKPLSALASAMVDALKAASPSELTVEFGVELGGAAGIPLVTKSEGKANFKVQLKWTTAKKDGKTEGDA